MAEQVESAALNQTMSEIKACLEQQLGVLQSIARWSDQTALYTSHLQNIKVAADQTKHYQAGRQAADAQVVRLLEEANAARQVEDPEQPEEQPVLDGAVPLLEQIAENTRITAEQITVMADATREPAEDKRETKEKVGGPVKGEKAKLDKAKEGSMSQVASEAGGFIGKLVKWFATMSLLLLPLLLGPEKLFESLRGVFASLSKLFTSLVGFVLNTLGPLISNIMTGLLNVFNKIAGPLGDLGSAIGDLVEKFSPKINAALEWFFEFLGDGLVAFIDMLTKGLDMLPDAFKAIKDTIGTMLSQWFDLTGEYDTWSENLTGTFKEWGEKFQNYMSSGVLDDFEDLMVTAYNGIINGLNFIATGLIDFYVNFSNSWAGWAMGFEEISDEDRDQMISDYTISSDRLITDDERNLSRRYRDQVDFSQSDEDVDEQIDALNLHHVDDDGNVIPLTRTIEELKGNKEKFRKGQQAEIKADFTRIRLDRDGIDSGIRGTGVGKMNNYTGLSKALNRDDIPDSLAFGTDGTGDFRDDNGLIVKAFDPEKNAMVDIPEDARMPLTMLIDAANKPDSGVLGIGVDPVETDPTSSGFNLMSLGNLIDSIPDGGSGGGGSSVAVGVGGSQSNVKTDTRNIYVGSPDPNGSRSFSPAT